MGRVRIGLIGCGKIAACSHAPEFLKILRKAVITGLFDPKEESARKIKSDLKLKADIFDSAERLLSSGVDGVVISSPNSLHHSLTMTALKAGVSVLVEKPMSVTLDEASEMIALAKKKKLVLQVNQSLRFSPVYVKIKELIDAGKIGSPLYIRCLRAGATSPDKGWSPGAKWFTQKKFAGGIIMDIAVHMADMMGWYFGKVTQVFSVNSSKIKGNDVPDNVTAVFSFENGATGQLNLSWTNPVGGGLLEIYGDKGAIRLGFNPDGLELASAPGKFKIVKPGKAKTSQEWFADSINGKPGCPVPGEVGLHALALCMALAESGETGKPVKNFMR
jgi:predicted dehydrogenase